MDFHSRVIKLFSNYQYLHLFDKRTNESITGTSIKTPTTVAKAAPEFKPKRAIATATANSKKLLAPIILAGLQMA
jgi:hypothetical protein